MKTYERDILAGRPEMKKTPYGVPEGYFDEFRMKMKAHGHQPAAEGAGPAVPDAGGQKAGRRTTFISIAASVALILGLVTFIISRTGGTEGLSEEDFLVFDPSIINTEFYEYAENIAEAEMAEEDIIEYLIYSGISIEEIEENLQ